MVGCDEFKAKKVHTLDLRKNKLSSLPESFGQLVNLHTLSLSNNKLSSLPESFGQLVNLHTLSLRNNKLSSLSPCLGNLRQLRHFYYSDNPVEHIPANVLRMINRTKLDKESIPTLNQFTTHQFKSLFSTLSIVLQHKRISILELIERGYNQEVISEWIGYIE